MMMQVLAFLNVLFIVIEGLHYPTSPDYWGSSSRQSSPRSLAGYQDYEDRYPSPTYPTGQPQPSSPTARPWDPPAQQASSSQPHYNYQSRPGSPTDYQTNPPQHASPPQPQSQGQRRQATGPPAANRRKRQRPITMASNTIVDLSEILDANGDGKIAYSDYVRMQESDLYKTNSHNVHSFLDEKFARFARGDKKPFATKNLKGCPIDLAELNNGMPFSPQKIYEIFRIPLDIARDKIVGNQRSTITAEDLSSYLKSSRFVENYKHIY